VAERSLDAILTEINLTLKTVKWGSFLTTYNECYQQTKDKKTFPLLNLGGTTTAHGKEIHWDDKEAMRVYHRVLSKENEVDNTKGFGNNPANVRVYSMRAVFLGTRRALTVAGYEDNDDFARDAENIFPSNLSFKELIRIDDIETIKNVVYEEEFEGVDLQKLSLDGIAFWINYTIRSRACTTVVVPTITIRNTPTPATFTQVLNCGADFTLADINVTKQDNTVVKHPAQTDLDVDDFNDACAAGTFENTDQSFSASVASGGTTVGADVDVTLPDLSTIKTSVSNVNIALVVADFNILYSFPQPTGQATSYRTGDDKNIEDTIWGPARDLQTDKVGILAKLADGTFQTLVDNNFTS